MVTPEPWTCFVGDGGRWRSYHPPMRHTARFRIPRLCVLLCVLAALTASCRRGSEGATTDAAPSPRGSTYAEARASFHSRLRTHGRAPQPYGPTIPRPDAREIPYTSGGLALKGWVSAPPADGKRRPGVVFLHGGFAFGDDDWDMTKPYRDAGYVVLVPMLRGENGLPGDFSMFYAEIDDALAAADALAALPYVQPDHLYVAGHSIGGTHALLAAMYSGRFRAAASFSGSPNQRAWIAGGWKEQAPFDTDDDGEIAIRSPLVFARSFRCPVRAYHGTEEAFFAKSTAQLAELARGAGLDVRAVPVPGDHMSHVDEAMRQSIAFFHEHE